MDDNVVPINKWAVPPPPNEPNQELVKMLEDYLDQAKNAQIDAMAFAVVSSSTNSTRTSWVLNGGATDYMLAQAIMILNARYAVGLLPKNDA